MDYDVVITRERAFARVTITGNPTVGELLALIHLLGVESETWGDDRVLVDLRGVATPFSKPEQYRIGEDAAACLSHMEKIASVVPAERVTRVSEKAARRMGANVMVFDDEEAAAAWLRSP